MGGVRPGRATLEAPLSRGSEASRLRSPALGFCRLRRSSRYASGMQKLIPMNMLSVIAQGFLNSLFLPSRSGPSSS
jgi:hypothetical protein